MVSSVAGIPGWIWLLVGAAGLFVMFWAKIKAYWPFSLITGKASSLLDTASTATAKAARQAAFNTLQGILWAQGNMTGLQALKDLESQIEQAEAAAVQTTTTTTTSSTTQVEQLAAAVSALAGSVSELKALVTAKLP